MGNNSEKMCEAAQDLSKCRVITASVYTNTTGNVTIELVKNSVKSYCTREREVLGRNTERE